MDFFNDLGRYISDTADTIGKKTNEVVEVQRLKSRMQSNQKEIDRNLLALGKLVYKKFEAGEVMAEEYFSLCQEIEKNQDVLQEYKKQMAKVKGLLRCPNCQSYITEDMEFCSKCGTKMENEI